MRTLLVVFALSLAIVAGAAARNPRLEQLALTPADTQLARSAVLRVGDLAPGWTARALEPDDTSAPPCPGQDYSRFTITGQAQTQFSMAGGSVVSRVEVYRSRADAFGDFAVSARPGSVACEAAAIRKAWSAQGIQTRVISALQLPRPKIGERSIAFRIVLGVSRAGREVLVYVNVVGFVRDRSAAGVTVVRPRKPLMGEMLLAQTIDSRLRRAA